MRHLVCSLALSGIGTTDNLTRGRVDVENHKFVEVTALRLPFVPAATKSLIAYSNSGFADIQKMMILRRRRYFAKVTRRRIPNSLPLTAKHPG